MTSFRHSARLARVSAVQPRALVWKPPHRRWQYFTSPRDALRALESHRSGAGGQSFTTNTDDGRPVSGPVPGSHQPLTILQGKHPHFTEVDAGSERPRDRPQALLGPPLLGAGWEEGIRPSSRAAWSAALPTSPVRGQEVWAFPHFSDRPGKKPGRYPAGPD